MRKGLWSPDEDERLVRCITKYANGSWSDIARKAGLDRCGKSCRRRWMNHLRPDLKRGKFSMNEISLIVQLHEVLGNRWSDIASHLEGRTDNDVKNLWNTQIKKRFSLLKSQNLSSSTLPATNFSSNTDALCTTTNNVDLYKGDLIANNMGFLHSSTLDEYENGNMQVLRFGGCPHGSMQEYNSCSASSCEASDQLSLNDQENSSRKPNSHALSSALNLPQPDVNPHRYNNIFLWSSDMQSNIIHIHHDDARLATAEHTSSNHTSLIMPCSSSSNLMSSGIASFLQLSPLPPDERAVPSCLDALLDLHHQESHQAAFATAIASLQSSGYVRLKTGCSCSVADDNEECSSLHHNLPATSPILNHVPESYDQMTKCGIGAIDNILSANSTTVNCIPSSEIAHYCNNDHLQVPQQRAALQFSRSNANVSVNMNANIYKGGDNYRRISTINEPPAAAGFEPVNVISADSAQAPSPWGKGPNEDLHQLLSNYVNMEGAAVAGWDYCISE